MDLTEENEGTVDEEGEPFSEWSDEKLERRTVEAQVKLLEIGERRAGYLKQYLDQH